MSRVTWARTCIASLLVFGAAVSWAGPASAHSQLVSVSPADGSVLSKPPTEVAFTFDENLLPGVDVLAVSDAEGTVLASTPVEPEGPTVRMAWPAGLAAGTYQVSYRIVSGDGHPVTGAIVFTVTADPPAVPMASSGTSAVGTAPSADDAGQMTPESGRSDGFVLGIVIGLGAVAVLAAGLLAWFRHRRR